MGIQVENLNCFRGNRLILQNVELSCEDGDCLILRGPNGSGKTTLLRNLAGLSGKHSQTADFAPTYLGHSNGIKGQLTVLENCQFWAKVYTNPLTTELLDQLNLVDLKSRLAARLSAGQSRRLAMARVFLSGAKVWLLDEPTNALDTESAKAITDAIKDHCNAGGIAVLSTHLSIDLPSAQVLDISAFAPAQEADAQNDPFLKGDFV